VNQSEPLECASALLSRLDQLVSAGSVEPDLGLELGLSAWMRMTGTAVDDAPAQMLRIRRALLDAAGLDSATEPAPFIGRSARSDVLHLAIYLADLVGRAAVAAGCERGDLVEGALSLLALEPVRPSVRWNESRQLRSS
jgi:hypothetical protein